jgi:nicotinate phosphoribosyltransferase
VRFAVATLKTPPIPPLSTLLDEVNSQRDALCELRFTADELQYLRGLRFIKSDFVDYLELFQLKRRFIKATLDAGGRLDIRIEGSMIQAMMFEIYVLAIVNDMGQTPLNIVLKLVECNDQSWQ